MSWRRRGSEHGYRAGIIGRVWGMVLIRLYGWISEDIGWREKEIEFRGSLKVLLALIDEEIENMVARGKLLVAVNHKVVNDLDEKIGGNDIVAVLPIFSGG